MSSTIEVMFPDGLRQVPGRPRIKEIQSLGGRITRVDLGAEPVPDPAWNFIQMINRSWKAFPN